MPVAAVTWEDEEEEEEEEEVQAVEDKGPVDPSTLKPKQLKKLKMKQMEEKRKMNVAIARARAAEQAKETDAERKAREQAAIEEADYENTLDAFGDVAIRPTATKTPAVENEDLAATFQRLNIRSLAQHEELGEVLGRTLSTSVGYNVAVSSLSIKMCV